MFEYGVLSSDLSPLNLSGRLSLAIAEVAESMIISEGDDYVGSIFCSLTKCQERNHHHLPLTWSIQTLNFRVDDSGSRR